MVHPAVYDIRIEIMDKPVKAYYETSPDGDKRVVAVESLGITIRLP